MSLSKSSGEVHGEHMERRPFSSTTWNYHRYQPSLTNYILLMHTEIIQALVISFSSLVARYSHLGGCFWL